MKNKTVFSFVSHTELGADCHRNGLCCAEGAAHQDICVFLSVVVFWVHNFICCRLKQLGIIIIHITELLQSGSSELF